MRIDCPYCLSSEVRKRGFSRLGEQRYECRECGKYYNTTTGNIVMDNPKILVFDIETSPIQVFVWNLYPKFVSTESVIQDWFVLSWAAKWLDEKKVMSAVLTSKEAKNCDDSRIVMKVWELLNEADIVIAHNGDRFDISRLNSRFLEHGLLPPLPYKSIDTLKSVRRVFGFTSNKLDYLTKKLSIGKKLKTGYQLWLDCVKGDTSSLRTMVKYNVHDVKILEDFYYKLRPWIPNHPNLGLYSANVQHAPCPVCGHKVIISKSKVATTPAYSWKVYRCSNPECGHTGRTKIRANKSRENNSKLIAR